MQFFVSVSTGLGRFPLCPGVAPARLAEYPLARLHPDLVAEAGCRFVDRFLSERVRERGEYLSKRDDDKRLFPVFVIAGHIVEDDDVDVHGAGSKFISRPFSAERLFDGGDDILFQPCW